MMTRLRRRLVALVDELGRRTGIPLTRAQRMRAAGVAETARLHRLLGSSPGSIPTPGDRVWYKTPEGYVPAVVVTADDGWCIVRLLHGATIVTHEVPATLIVTGRTDRAPWLDDGITR